ncbi:MAG: COP23 domain-containing protein [Cyanobacteria bacterium P01_G01_bin.39]
MKLPTLKSPRTSLTLAIASSIMAASTSTNLAQAQTAKGFTCDVATSTPTTMYHNSQGGKEPWIKWVSNHFSGSNWTPLTRCQTVSDRLEEYRLSGKLKYVTLGMENEQQIICVASRDNGPCEGIIYTLRPGQDGIAALNNLFAWGSGQQNLDSNYESASTIPYINVGEKLLQADGN